MKVFYSGRQGKAEVVYQQERVEPCCESMARFWGKLVGLGTGQGTSTSRTANLLLTREQANGKSVLEAVAIDYCPWCGEVIEVSREKPSTMVTSTGSKTL